MLLAKDRAPVQIILTTFSGKFVYSALNCMDSSHAGSTDIKNVIREKLEKLAERKKALGTYLETLETRAQRNQDAKEARLVIEDKVKAFKKGWHKATPSTQKRLIRRLIESLVYTPEGLKTHYVTAMDVELDLPASQSKKAPDSFPGALPFKSTIQSIFSGVLDGTQPVRGSPVVGTGGGDAIVVEPLHVGETCLVRWKK